MIENEYERSLASELADCGDSLRYIYHAAMGHKRGQEIDYVEYKRQVAEQVKLINHYLKCLP